MKNNVSLPLKKREMLLILAGFLISIWGKFQECFVGLGFDSQSFQFWNYAHSLNLVPYRDFFYPYGLIFFLKTNNVFWQLVSVILVFVSIFSIYLLLKQIFKKFQFAYIYYLLVCIYISLFMNFDSILRYVSLFPFIFLIFHFIENKTFFSKKHGFFTGIILGIYFSFINDLFVYSIIALVLFILFYFIKSKSKISEIKNFGLFFLIGFLAGATPLIAYLAHNNSIYAFADNYRLLKDISIYAKVPFPPTLKSMENFVVLFSISLSLVFVYEKYRTKKINPKIYFHIFLIILLVVIEQKNIIRANYQQISIFGFFLLLLLVSQFKNKIILFIIPLSFMALVITDRARANYHISVSAIPINFCENINSDLDNYINVRNYIKQKNIFSKIYSFPGDPVFYSIFNQTPPYYPSIYEATPKYAQEKQIQYIREKDVNFIIINTLSESIQDGVPDDIRGRHLLKYIKDNYKFDNKINEFEILIRK